MADEGEQSVKRVCVAGAAGYIGSWLVKNPLERGYTGTFDSAVEGCHGVFHVASPMDFTKSNLDDFTVPIVNGVHNVMRACVRAKYVRRIVFTSSVMAASPRNEKGEFTQTCLDERCWSRISFGKSQPNKAAWYMIAKTLAEEEALKYEVNYNIEVVSILPAVVI